MKSFKQFTTESIHKEIQDLGDNASVDCSLSLGSWWRALLRLRCCGLSLLRCCACRLRGLACGPGSGGCLSEPARELVKSGLVLLKLALVAREARRVQAKRRGWPRAELVQVGLQRLDLGRELVVPSAEYRA